MEKAVLCNGELEVEAVDEIRFVRPPELLGVEVELPNADVCEAQDLREALFGFAEGALDRAPFGDIEADADGSTDVTGGVKVGCVIRFKDRRLKRERHVGGFARVGFAEGLGEARGFPKYFKR